MKRGILKLLAVFAVSFAVAFLSQYIEQQNSVQKIKSVRSEQQREAERRLRDPNYRNESRQTDEIERLKNSVGGKNAVLLDAVSEIIQEMVLISSQFESAEKEASTVFEFGAIRTPENIGESIEKAKQAEKAANIMNQTVREMGPKLKEALIRRRVLQPDIDSTMRGFHRTAEVDRKSELYKMNAEVWKEAKVLLQILEKEWGAWKYEELEGGVLFESDSAVTEFNNTMERIGDLALKIEKLQLTILKNQAGEGN